MLARFGHHHFVASQQVDLIWMADMLTKEHPQQQGPWECLGEHALDGAVTPALARPTGEAQHRDPARHHPHGPSQPTQLAQGRRRHMRAEALERCSHVHEAFSFA